MPFQFTPLDLPGVTLIEAQSFPDDRGEFLETYKQSAFEAHGVPWRFVQDNLSFSRRGVVRGLHYQKDPMAQGKLISVLAGEIYDVAVDLRRGSPTYGKWIAVTLAADRHRMLFVPPGFAHGFQALTDRVQVWYKATAEYAPEVDRGIAWNDPSLGIEWPLSEAILSAKDRQLPLLADADNNFHFQGPG